MIKIEHGVLSFGKKVSERTLPRGVVARAEANHKALADPIGKRGLDCASIIMIEENLHEELWRNPQYVRIDWELGLSEIQLEAAKCLQGKYPTLDEIKKTIKRHKLPTRKNNYESDDRKFYYELEQKVYAAYEMMQFPRLVIDMKEQFEDEWMSDHPTGKPEDRQVAWREELIRIMLPSANQKAQRMYSVPFPLGQWDARNPWQQFYFVQYGEEIRWTYGGPASSGQREQHGRWAHVFAVLEDKYKQDIPTYCFVYDAQNQLKFVRKYERLKVVRNELSGNYPVSYESTKKLFRHRMVSVSDGIKDVM